MNAYHSVYVVVTLSETTARLLMTVLDVIYYLRIIHAARTAVASFFKGVHVRTQTEKLLFRN